MQKIIILILAIISSGFVNIWFAADAWETVIMNNGTKVDVSTQTPTSSSSSSVNTIFTSEAVPGASCKCVADWAQDYTFTTTDDTYGVQTWTVKWTWESACGANVAKRKYECTVPTGLDGFQSVFAQIIRFVINIVLLLGVLSVVGLGIAWSFAWGDDIKAKSTLKMWAINILIGLAILFFFRYILLFLAPWVYQ